MKENNIIDKLYGFADRALNLAVKQDSPKISQRRDGYIGKVIPKAISRTRNDVATWKGALRSATSADNPRRAKLYNLYDDITLDAHITSQIELRLQHALATPFELKHDGKLSEVQTNMLKSARWVNELNRHILNSLFYGHSLVEITTTNSGEIEVSLLPRNNVIPEKGLFLLNEDDNKGIAYRELREYGTWILEFGSRSDLGLLNKAVPHALFKRFAQSCWSELCEIYGIPPRVMKTNTQDAAMLDRAESMMRDMGSAAWFIIDDTENFEWAKGADSNGDVYKNLIALCNNEMSLLITGAVVGQDTVNGNRSKEESSLKLFDKITQSDKRILEAYWNGVVIPALVRIGLLPEGLTYELQQEEDLEKLFEQSHKAMQYYDIDPVWIKDKFGIAVIGKREQSIQQNLSADFFD